MEPFSILGAASAIVTSLHFSSKLMHGSFEIYQSAHGAASTNVVLENVTKDLDDFCQNSASVKIHADGSEISGADLSL